MPVHDLLSILDDELKECNLPLHAPTIIELIKLCILDSKLTLNDEYYCQTFGMAMANPLSPVLSNIYMAFLEKHLLPNILSSSAIWFRFIDDILCIWPSDEDVCDFLSSLHNLVSSIKFTYETKII